MNPFFIWLIKSTISLALLYIVFKLATSRDKIHTINRFLLMGIMLFSAVIPFLNFQFFESEAPVKSIEAFRELVSMPPLISNIAVPEIQQVQAETSVHINPFLIFYLAFIMVLLIRLTIAVVCVIHLTKDAEKQRFRKIVLAVVKDLIQPFTFLNQIILSEKDFNENKEIVVAHEYAHIKHFHAIDIVLCELFTMIHWFNPFMWLLRHDLKLIHEYQADQAVLNKGIDAKKYQLLVLEKAVGERRFAMANHFTQKPILKRFKMMNTKKSKRTWLKLMLFVPVLAILSISFSSSYSLNNKALFIISDLQKSIKEWKSLWSYPNLNDLGKVTTIAEVGKYCEYEKSPSLDKEDILWIIVNKDDKTIINGTVTKKDKVGEEIENFISGKLPNGEKVKWVETKDIPYFGNVPISMGIISFRFDIQSSYMAVQELTEKIGTAYLNLRDEKSLDKFNQPFLSLNEEQKKAVEELVPIRITTGEPKLDKEKNQVVFIK